VPASYGQASYHAEHAFRFSAADGTSRFGRYHWVPEAGEAYLSPDEASTRSANFLREELESRLRSGAVGFRLVLQLAAEGDPTDDVTALWPADRTMVELGRLKVTGISPTGAADERPPGVRPHQSNGRHRAFGGSDSAGAVVRLLHVLRPSQRGHVSGRRARQ
jgi:catalase